MPLLAKKPRSRVAKAFLLAVAVGLPTLASAAPMAPHATPPVPTAPYAGYVNHAHNAPAFHWGWFGAERYAQRARWHRDYNGDVLRWNTFRRY